jgi:hypothetical protein
MRRKGLKTAWLAIALVGAFAGAALAGTVTETGNASTLAGTIAGAGVTVSNEAYTGVSQAAGTFTGFGSAIGIADGILLTSGKAGGAVGPNNVGNYSVDNDQAGDSTLDSILPSGSSSRDASVLQFDFTVASAGSLYFNYVFASDEYEEWSFSQYNDVFGFFIQGGVYGTTWTNLALIPATTTAVSVNTVNQSTNSTYYNSNTSAWADTQYDGFTDLFTVQATGLVTGTTYKMKLAIADVSDDAWDSAVFIQAKTFSTDPTAVPLPSAVWLGMTMLGTFGLVRRFRRRRERT